MDRGENITSLVNAIIRLQVLHGWNSSGSEWTLICDSSNCSVNNLMYYVRSQHYCRWTQQCSTCRDEPWAVSINTCLCELNVPLAFRSLSCNPSATFFFFITSPSHLSSCRLSSQQHAVQSLSLSLSLWGLHAVCMCLGWQTGLTHLPNAFIPPPSSSCSFAPSLSNHRWLAVHLYASLSLRCVWYVRWLHSSVRLIFPLVLFFPTEWWGGVGGGGGGGVPSSSPFAFERLFHGMPHTLIHSIPAIPTQTLGGCDN